MTFINALPAQNSATKSLNLRQNPSERYFEWFLGLILGRKNTNEGHFRLVAMFATNQHKWIFLNFEIRSHYCWKYKCIFSIPCVLRPTDCEQSYKGKQSKAGHALRNSSVQLTDSDSTGWLVRRQYNAWDELTIYLLQTTGLPLSIQCCRASSLWA